MLPSRLSFFLFLFKSPGMLAVNQLLPLQPGTKTRIWCLSEGFWTQLSTWKHLKDRCFDLNAATLPLSPHLQFQYLSIQGMTRTIKRNKNKYENTLDFLCIVSLLNYCVQLYLQRIILFPVFQIPKLFGICSRMLCICWETAVIRSEQLSNSPNEITKRLTPWQNSSHFFINMNFRECLGAV